MTAQSASSSQPVVEPATTMAAGSAGTALQVALPFPHRFRLAVNADPDHRIQNLQFFSEILVGLDRIMVHLPAKLNAAKKE